MLYYSECGKQIIFINRRLCCCTCEWKMYKLRSAAFKDYDVNFCSQCNMRCSKLVSCDRAQFQCTTYETKQTNDRPSNSISTFKPFKLQLVCVYSKELENHTLDSSIRHPAVTSICCWSSYNTGFMQTSINRLNLDSSTLRQRHNCMCAHDASQIACMHNPPCIWNYCFEMKRPALEI